MRALVINLDRETERLAFQQRQAAALGIELERAPAVTVADITPQASDSYWQRWQRPLRDVEKATLLSHRAAWKRVLELGQPTLVLEDDAWLMPGAPSLIAQALTLDGVEFLTLETRGRRKLLGKQHPQCRGIRRLWLDRTGAAAYVLWPEGARKLLARSDTVPALADAVLVETPQLLRWQAAPAQAIQLDMASRYGLMAPLVTESAISPAPRPAAKHIGYKAQRIAAQLRAGLSQLRPGTELVEIRPALGEDRDGVLEAHRQ